MPAASPPGIVAPSFPGIVPLFPLRGGIILPRGRLPLRMHSPEDRALADHLLAGDRLLGVIQPNDGLPPGPHGPTLYGIGCLGRLIGFEEEEEGVRINLSGRLRFHLVEERASPHPWRRASVDYEAWRGDLAMEDIVLGPRRQALAEALKRFFVSRGMHFSRAMLDRFPDAVLPTALCAACPFAPREKQALLEADTEDRRVELLLLLLEMAANERRPDGTVN